MLLFHAITTLDHYKDPNKNEVKNFLPLPPINI